LELQLPKHSIYGFLSLHYKMQSRVQFYFPYSVEVEKLNIVEFHFVSRIKKTRLAPHEVGNYLAQNLIVFAAYFVADHLGKAPLLYRGNISPVWPASGLVLAAILIWGYRVLPGIITATYTLAFFDPLPHLATFGQSTGTILGALTGAFLLRRIAHFQPSLSRLRDALSLIVLGAMGSSIVSASVGITALYAAHVRAWPGIGSAWMVYWMGDSMGVLLVTPLMLTFPNLLRIRPRARVAELSVLQLIVTAACFIIFGDLGSVPIKLHVLAFVVFPFVIWAAIRFGVCGASLTTVLIASISTAETSLGSGPFAQNTPVVNAASLNLFFAVLSVTGMTLAAVIAEREEAESNRERLFREKVATEGRLRLATIVESSSDAIIGLGIRGIITDWNQGAERLYGYSAGEARGRPISLLILPEHSHKYSEIMDKLTSGETVKDYETVCQVKDGACREVSLTASPIRDFGGQVVGASVIAHDVSERKRQEAALRESEERFRLVADTAPVLIWMAGTDKLYTFFNKGWLDFTGRSMEQELGEGWATGVHPNDLERCLGIYTGAFEARVDFEMEYRLRRHDGVYRWIVDYGVPRFESSGVFCGYIGSAIDITDRRSVEESLQELSGRLINAQEEERTRIARELHDDLSQRMALLQIGLEQFEQDRPELSRRAREQLHEIAQTASDVSSDLHNLSHQLHPSKLDTLGLAVALKSFCIEFSKQHDLRIQFADRDVPAGIPKDVTLCLFRIVQEALRNVVKHSAAKEVKVEITGREDRIDLCVSDTGVGFDPNSAWQNTGMGLISMRERARLVGGYLSVESEMSLGTRIRVQVPLALHSVSIPDNRNQKSASA
jgi:PAS domain S-box-containing protein